MTTLTATETLQLKRRWRSNRIRRYLRLVDQFRRLLLLCVHFIGGMPARGPELLTLRFRNGIYQDRNLYLIDGCIVVITRYHKSQALMDQPKVVPRRLTPQLSQIITVYLAYVQPFQEHLRYVLAKENRSDYLWHSNTGAWDTDQLTGALQQETSTWLGYSLGTQDYRHLAISLGREVAGASFTRQSEVESTEVEEPEVDEEDAFELQSRRGRTIGTLRYGVSVDLVHNLSAQSLATFRLVSELWQEFLQLGHSQLSLTTTVAQTPVRTTGHKRGLSVETYLMTQHRSYPSVVASNTPVSSSISDQYFSPLVFSPRRPELIPGQLGSPFSVKKETPVTTDYRDQITAAMHQLFGGDDVKFTSPAQYDSILAVLRNESPLAVVLPTGGGKTILTMVAAVVDPDGTSIFITPFRVLTDEMVIRFQQASIRSYEWVPGNTDLATVIVVSADRAAGYEFLTFAQSLQQRGHLRRVFIDEAHLTLTASDWRPRLHQLRSLRVLQCPLILLTATLPPMLEYHFEEGLALRQVRYIRASTIRPQHRYYVQQCSTVRLSDEAVLLGQRWQRRILSQRGIVYCRSQASCTRLAQALSCPSYHAQQADREEHLHRWRQFGGLIISTSALGSGINIPGVILTVHIGLPWSMVDFAQESGRGGRQGEVVDSVILVDTDAVQDQRQQGQYSIDQAAIADFVTTSQCRRFVMSEYLDGVGQGRRCASVDGGQRCDRCGEGISVLVTQEGAIARLRARVQQRLDELTSGCGFCWVITGRVAADDHDSSRCRRWSCSQEAAVAQFRRQIRYPRGGRSCHRCGIDQRWCQRGRPAAGGCRWPFVLVPVVRATVSLASGQATVRQLGYEGDFAAGLAGYSAWLGRDHGQRVCGLWMSSGMAVLVRVLGGGVDDA